jgi:hypothetical protein
MALPLRWLNFSVQVTLLSLPASLSLPLREPVAAAGACARGILVRCDFSKDAPDAA